MCSHAHLSLVLRVELHQLRQRGKLFAAVEVVVVPRVLYLDVRHLGAAPDVMMSSGHACDVR